MSDGTSFACPQCGCADHLVIYATTSVLLLQGHHGEFETVAVDGAHEWDDESPMLCKTCGYSGEVLNFDKEERDASD